MTDEVSGAEPVSRRTRSLVLAVLLVVALAFAADRWQSERELDQLLAAVADGEQVIDRSQSSLSSLVEYQAPLLAGGDVPAEAQKSAYANLSRDAARWQPVLDGPRRRVAEVRMLPWHQDLREGKAAYAVRVQRWADVLEQTRVDPQRSLQTRNEVGRSKADALDALLAAAGGERERVRVLLG